MDPSQITQALSEAQTVQQVLATVVGVEFAAILLLGKLYLDLVKAKEQEIKQLYQDQLAQLKNFADAIRGDHDGGQS